MQFFPKKYRTEVFHYFSDKDLVTLKNAMEGVLKNSSTFKDFFFTKMTGEFTSEHAFRISPKARIGYSQKNIPARLEGELIAKSDNTEIVFMLSPVPFHIPFFASIALGIYGLIQFILILNSLLLIAAIGLLFVVPVFILAIVAYEKRSLKNEFVKAFHLKPSPGSAFGD